MSWLRRLEAKAAEDQVHFTPIHPDRGGFAPLSRTNYGALVNRGLNSNVVMAPVQWVMRSFPEAEPVVEHKAGSDRPWKHKAEHDLELLLRRPNDGYDGACLMQATALSYIFDGNAYWLKRRNVFGQPIEYWYVPHWAMEPVWPRGGSSFISHYRYTPNDGPPALLPRNDVVHLRFGIDPHNTRLGLSQVKSLMREIYTDEEAAAFSAAILKNMGVPGLVISPKADLGTVSPDEVAEIKRHFMTSHSGDHRGEPVVMSGPTDVAQFGFDPNRLMLGNLRDIVEERVCATLGIPAAVVGFGAGLQATKVGATMREMRRLAWVQCIIPMQLAIGRQLTQQLVPDFEDLTHRWRVRFDTSGVSAFQEEETERANRLKALVAGGILRVDQAQEEAGVEVDESQAVYLRPTNAIAVEVGDSGIAPRAAPNPAPGEPPADPAPDPTAPTAPASPDVMAEARRAAAQLAAQPTRTTSRTSRTRKRKES